MKKILFILIAIAGIGAGIAYGDGIDPGVLVRKTGQFGVDESLNNEPRPGVDVDEINLMSIDPKVTAAIAKKMNSAGPVAVNGGLYNGNWVSLANLFTTVGISDQPTKDAFNKWFASVDAKKDAEAYWGDKNKNNSIEPDEWYHRFNLARTDWDTMTIANLFAAPVAYLATAVSHNGGGLRWLANFGKDAAGNDVQSFKGTFPNVEARRNQIAANLIDYCDGIGDFYDPDNKDLTKHEVTRDSDTDPTYTGNELTPYINEIGIVVEGTAHVEKKKISEKSEKSEKYVYKNTYVFGDIDVYCEIANVYYDLNWDFSASTHFEILEGSISLKWSSSNGDLTPIKIPIPASGKISITPVGDDDYKTKSFTINIDHSYQNFGDSGYMSAYVGDTSYPHSAALTDVKVQIKRARLWYNNVFADFAKPDYDNTYSDSLSTLVTQDKEGDTTQLGIFSYQVNDPRQNLNDGDWPTATAVAGPSNSKYGKNKHGEGHGRRDKHKYTRDLGNTIGTLDEENEDVVTYVTDGDMEVNQSPTTLSTAYIRNGPMVSPWELGAIHRGAAWETINLKEYNAVAGANPLTGGGLYKESASGKKDGGDANILDQIKMTSKVENKQKVNLSLKNDDTSGSIGYGILSALFKKIHVGTDSYANNVRILRAMNNLAALNALSASNKVIDEKWVAIDSGNLYYWSGAAWVPITTKSVGDSYFYNASNGVKIYNGAAWGTWSDASTAISDTDVKAIVNDIKSRSSTCKTRASVIGQASALINRSGQSTDREKEEIIGKTINLTTVAPSGYFTIIIIAQSIKDVGPGTFSKDLDMNGIISNPPPLGSLGGGASEVILGADINGDGDSIDTGIPETITKTAFGTYKQYADEIMAEQKIRADVYRNPQTGKYTIIRMEYVEE